MTVTWGVVAGAGAVAFANPHAAQTTATFDTPGEYILRLTADDAEQTASDEIRVVVYEPITGPAPTVTVTSPADGSVVTARTDIFGTVSGGSWRLEYALNTDGGSSAQVWTGVASGSGPVTNGKLGTIDPTLLLNGNYSFRLTATDASGQTTVINTGVTVSGAQKIGNFSLSFNDLEVPVAGLPIQVVRTYDSREKRTGDFGTGWTLGVKNVRLEKDGPVSKGWEQTVAGGFLPRYCLQATRAHVITVTFPDGKVYRFQAATSPQCLQIYPISNATVVFKPLPGDAGTQGATLVPLGGTEVLVQGGVPGAAELYSYSDLRNYDPSLFKLTTADGRSYVIDQRLGVRSMTDANGNTLTVNSSGIVHSAGKSVTFTRDAQGRITKITDPAGASMSYAYDAAGDLVGFTDRENTTTTFAYNSTHGLLSVKDPRGVQPVRNEYDDAGRLLSHTDAFGKTVTYTHDLDGRREKVVDRMGRETVYEYDARGNVVQTVGPTGLVTSATYDARGNKLTETNAAGKTVAYTYDARDNRLTETDALGNTTRYTYNARNQTLTSTDALGRVTTHTYDANGNLTSTKDAQGNTTSATYTRGGLIASAVDAQGNVTRFEYDATGRVVKSVNGQGQLSSYTYDANGNRLTSSETHTTAAGAVGTLTTTYKYDRLGRVVKTTYPDGTASETAHDSAGRKAADVDALGRRTSFAYDDAGRLVRTTYPDNTKEETTYDAEGRRLTFTDRAGRTTRYEYDDLGRLTKTTAPDETFTSAEYDELGRVSAAKDARGHRATFEYDPACGCAERLTKVTNAAGKATTYTYDALGRRASVTDARGNTTRYEYDELGRVTKVTHPNGTTSTTAYDTLGRRVGSTDPAGRTTRFEYDELGRPVKVSDALEQATAFAYDEVGNLVSQTDARGNTTRYEYDRLGRRTKRTLPEGMSELYAYDAAGQLTGRTDFNGKTTAYGYDSMGRLLSKTPDPSLNQPGVTYTYTATGQRATMTDATGTTVYTHDTRERLTSKATPQGTLTYTYDAAGNLLTTRSSNAEGVSVNYTYDELGRLSSALDNRAGGDPTTYTYDAAGNLEGYAYRNGVRTGYTYDALNRLTRISAEKAAGAVAAYAYTLGAAGNRLSVAELSGRTVSYTYDAVYRLTGETVAGDSSGANGEVGYTFDAVGNRTARASTLAGVTAQADTYDKNDRLTSDLYDANGNTKQSNGVEYAYDWEDRLSSAHGGSVTYAYDGDGHRVSKTVGGVTTRYLVDSNNPTGYSQIVDELQGGAVVRQYTYGHDLISQRRLVGGQWAVSFYGYDGQGSVRYLTDEAGAVTDTYTYDAFGVLVARTGATPNEYLYSGERFDPETGLYHLRARYMRPETGRFWTQDSFEGFGSDPRSLHKYTYAGADPVNLNDPGGHVFGLIGAAASGVVRGMSGLNYAVVMMLVKEALLGALIGGAVGAADAALGGGGLDEVIRAAFWGAGVGAVLLPLTLHFAIVAEAAKVFGVVMTIVGVADSIENGNYAQAVFRAASGPALAYGLGKLRAFLSGARPTGAGGGGAGSPGSVPGRVQSRINPANGPTRFTPLRNSGKPVSAGLDHVIDGHFNNTNTQSQFTISVNQLKALLQRGDIVHSPVTQVGSGAQAQYVRYVDTGGVVGTVRQSQGGGPTTWLKIFTDGAGNLITTFPVPPPGP